MADVKLKIVPKPEPKTRVLLTLSSNAGPILKGNANAPRFCCGDCGASLIEGVHANQFVDGTRNVFSERETWNLIPLAIKEHVASKTMTVRSDTVITVTMNGPLLLTCYQCQSVNEMFAPNVVGPLQ